MIDAPAKFSKFNFNTVCAIGFVVLSGFLFVIIPTQIEKPMVIFGQSLNALDPALFPSIVASAFGILPKAQWEMAVNTLTSISGGCLLIAMAAVGLSTNLASFKQVGLRPLGLGLAAAITTGLLSGTLIHFFY